MNNCRELELPEQSKTFAALLRLLLRQAGGAPRHRPLHQAFHLGLQSPETSNKNKTITLMSGEENTR